ncbi:hypothetical protein DFH07DRAFT_959878 [Mycena maculata]|uniref:Uncharacterized protein n=1 Tax=Mycena maculata TaxID=230809 RepID=A0AAD7J1D9_9AGAR|nr:hypothetical protein DFH07DRAFT_959878 [Mycena maculata]
MFFAQVALAGAVLLSLSSSIAGIPSAPLDAPVAVNRSPRPIDPPEIFYSGSGTAKWPNGSSVDFGPAPMLKATSTALQERQAEIACYDVGTEIADELAKSLLTTWCEAVLGAEVTGSTLYGRYNLGNGQSLLLSITADSGREICKTSNFTNA